MDGQTLDAVWVTLKLATMTTVILIALGIPLAWWLANSRSTWARVVESIVTLPIILPPTVLGFYLLMAFAPNSSAGQLFESVFGTQLAFSFTGILLGSMVYSLPFAVSPLQNAFNQFDNGLLEVGATYGYTPRQSFFKIALPICKHSVFSAALLCFAHTVGEFGVVLMIGGNIAGETQVMSIAIFDAVEALDYNKAHQLSLALLIFAVLALTLINVFKSRQERDART